ncbi:MAG: ABC transporter substrate-binding protein, partial [Eubacteriales bacterium]|nr:ABC transporter substrate-binding protein [Eubacteriales bacterium]
MCKTITQTDDLTFEFEIYDGIKFHNGRKVTAEDVKFSLEYVVDADAASALAVYFECLDNVEVTGELTGKIHLNKVYAPFLNKLTRVPIIPSESVGTLKTAPVGCGPFKFVKWNKDQSIEYEKFDDYWREGYPKMDGLVFKIMKEYNTIYSSFMAKELDILFWAAAKDAKQLEDTSGVYVHEQELADAFVVICNTLVKPFDDPRVRKAVALALDKQQCIDLSQEGYGVELDLPIYPGTYYYDEAAEYDRNIEEAKRLLAEAGYPNGFDCVLRAPITPVEGLLGDVIQAQLKEIGINAQLEEIEVSVFLDTVFVRKDFEITVCGDGGDGEPDTWISRYCKTGADNNFGGYSNPELDVLIEQSTATNDKDERKEIYKQIFAILKEEQPVTFLFGGVIHSAIKDELDGFEGRQNWRFYFDGVYRK